MSAPPSPVTTAAMSERRRTLRPNPKRSANPIELKDIDISSSDDDSDYREDDEEEEEDESASSASSPSSSSSSSSSSEDDKPVRKRARKAATRT